MVQRLRMFLATGKLAFFIGSRVQDARKSPIFVKPKLSISNVNAISELLVTNCPYRLTRLGCAINPRFS